MIMETYQQSVEQATKIRDETVELAWKAAKETTEKAWQMFQGNSKIAGDS